MFRWMRNYPKQRLTYMLQDTALDVVLTQAALRNQLPEYAGQLLCVDADASLWAESTAALPCAVDGESLAYVNYTSGSTGKPKGVLRAAPSRAATW